MCLGLSATRSPDRRAVMPNDAAGRWRDPACIRGGRIRASNILPSVAANQTG
jgi:uncharacterized protein (DUF433 family)